MCNGTQTSYADIVLVEDITERDTANLHIAYGWILLNTYVTIADYTFAADQTVHYVLGLPKDVDEANARRELAHKRAASQRQEQK